MPLVITFVILPFYVLFDRLIYSGRQLSDEKTLQEYNVAAGGTIHMVLQLRGG
jgi:hypothetical protein